MGDARFVVGFLQGALSKRTYPVELSLKVVESNKRALAEQHNAGLRAIATDPEGSDKNESVSGEPLSMPPLQFGSEQDSLPSHSEALDTLPMELEPGWHTLRTPVSYVYAGKMPFVSRDVSLAGL